MYWCANDGTVYDDLCRAQCIDKNIEFLWNCEEKNIMPNDKPQCDVLCKKEVSCFDKCKHLKTQKACGDDGKIYRNSCELSCAGKKTVRLLKGDCDEDEEEKKCKNHKDFVGASLK